MGATKSSFLEAQEEMIAKCEMPQGLFHRLSRENEGIVLRGHYIPSMKEEYKKDTEWVEANRTLKEAIQYREEIEERIRVEKAIARDIEKGNVPGQ